MSNKTVKQTGWRMVVSGAVPALFGAIVAAGMLTIIPAAEAQFSSDPTPQRSDNPMLQAPNQNFLQRMEQWEQRIRDLQYSLQEAELQVRMAEQQKRLAEINAEAEEVDFLSESGLLGSSNIMDALPRSGNSGAIGSSADAAAMASVNAAIGDPFADFQMAAPPPAPQPPEVSVETVRGVGGTLSATLVVDGARYMAVQRGDQLGPGRIVTDISQAGVTIDDEASGEVVTYAVSSRQNSSPFPGFPGMPGMDGMQFPPMPGQSGGMPGMGGGMPGMGGGMPSSGGGMPMFN